MKKLDKFVFMVFGVATLFVLICVLIASSFINLLFTF